MDCDDNLLLDKRNFFNFIQSSTYFKKDLRTIKEQKKGL